MRFHREMDCPVQWSLATPSALESQSRANQGSVVANPICKCRRHKAGHLQVRVAVGKRSTCVLKEAPLNQGPLGLPQEWETGPETKRAFEMADSHFSGGFQNGPTMAGQLWPDSSNDIMWRFSAYPAIHPAIFSAIFWDPPRNSCWPFFR